MAVTGQNIQRWKQVKHGLKPWRHFLSMWKNMECELFEPGDNNKMTWTYYITAMWFQGALIKWPPLSSVKWDTHRWGWMKILCQHKQHFLPGDDLNPETTRLLKTWLLQTKTFGAFGSQMVPLTIVLNNFPLRIHIPGVFICACAHLTQRRRPAGGQLWRQYALWPMWRWPNTGHHWDGDGQQR